MRTSATGNSRRRRATERGFTLIELMVVIVIIGLASAAVVLVMPDPRGSLISEAERLAARSFAARDEAIVQARDTSLWVTAEGYGFEQRAHGRWEGPTGKGLEPVNWSPGTAVRVGDGGRMRITFDSTGSVANPAIVHLSRDSAAIDVTFQGDGSIRVTH